jgi:antitoxin (DNA-binding transcriptional repressor) of toxin-antitoxin stability system
MTQVGIRAFKAELSRYLRQVRNGQPVLLTDRGQVIARALWRAKPDRRRPGALTWCPKSDVRLCTAVRHSETELQRDIGRREREQSVDQDDGRTRSSGVPI